MDAVQDALSQLDKQLTDLAFQHPRAAVWLHARLAASPGSFAHYSLQLQTGWLTRHAGPANGTVWSIGAAHPDCFSTLACAAIAADGGIPVTFGLDDLTNQRPAPWHWDLIQVLAGAAMDCPQWQEAQLVQLAERMLGEYVRTLTLFQQDDAELAQRIDMHGLPESLKLLIDCDHEPRMRKRHLTRYVRSAGGSARLNPALRLQRGSEECDELVQALQEQWSAVRPAGSWTCLDLGRCMHMEDDAAPGTHRWLAVVQEQTRLHGDQVRIIEIVALDGWPQEDRSTMASPLRAVTQGTAHDPCLGVVHTSFATVLVRTHGHAHGILHLPDLDWGDAIRLGQLWGQLIANIHVFDPGGEPGCAPGDDVGVRIGQTRLATLAHAAIGNTAHLAGTARALVDVNRRAHALWIAHQSQRRTVRTTGGRRAAGNP